jgi:hypothetical protein
MCIPASCEEEGAQPRRLFTPHFHSQREDDIEPPYADSSIALQLRKLHVTAGEQRPFEWLRFKVENLPVDEQAS